MMNRMMAKEDKFIHLKFRLPKIKTLAMLKMEKNFIALIEKGYPRQPYDDKDQSIGFLVDRIRDEVFELETALTDKKLSFRESLSQMKEECADISNIVDYLFEKLVRQSCDATTTTTTTTRSNHNMI